MLAKEAKQQVLPGILSLATAGTVADPQRGTSLGKEGRARMPAESPRGVSASVSADHVRRWGSERATQSPPRHSLRDGERVISRKYQDIRPCHDRHRGDGRKSGASLTVGLLYLQQAWPLLQSSAWVASHPFGASQAFTLQQAAASPLAAAQVSLPHAAQAHASQVQASPTQQPQSASHAPQGQTAALTKVASAPTAVSAASA